MPEEMNAAPDVVEEQDALDFDDSESRMNFLKSQLNDLLDGINNAYGQELMEELLKRLEKTVEDFNVEVSNLMGKLKSGKIFEEDSEVPEVADDDSLDSDLRQLEPADTGLEDMEAEDADVIARMKARITHD